MILETKLGKRGHKELERGGFTSTIEKSFICSTLLGTLLPAGAGFGAGMMMNAKSHFQNVGSFFTNKESEHQPDEVLRQKHFETPVTPDAPEPTFQKIKASLEGLKPVEKTPTPSMESPITVGPTPSSNEEFKTLKEEWISPFKQSALIALSTN